MKTFTGVTALVVGVLVLAFGVDLWLSQMTVWGLSLFHVDSGIWGPFLLLGVLGSVLGGAAASARSKD